MRITSLVEYKNEYFANTKAILQYNINMLQN